MQKILLVDNHYAMLNVMNILLTNFGYQVTTTTNYNTLIPIIKEDRPDMILLDVMLNNEDGREICKQLKDDSSTRDIYIILLSVSNFLLKDFKTYKADGTLVKPFSLEHFINLISISELLTNQQSISF